MSNTDRESVERLAAYYGQPGFPPDSRMRYTATTLLALLAERDALQAKLAEAQPITVQQAARRLLEAREALFNVPASSLTSNADDALLWLSERHLTTIAAQGQEDNQ